MRVILRSGIGLAFAAAGLTFLTYGIAQSINTGSCGSSSNGISYGPPCPSGFGPMIVLMVFGTFFAIGGAAVAGVLARFIGALVVAVIAGVVLGIVDLDDADTRPGLEILVAVLAPLLLFTLPAIGRPRRTLAQRTMGAMTFKAPVTAEAPEPDPTARPQWQPKTTAQAEDVASRLRQLDQLKASGLLSDAEYGERRTQILAEL